MSLQAKKPSLLIILFWYLDKDPRVLREVQALRDIFDITVASFGVGEVSGVRGFELIPGFELVPGGGLTFRALVKLLLPKVMVRIIYTLLGKQAPALFSQGKCLTLAGDEGRGPVGTLLRFFKSKVGLQDGFDSIHLSLLGYIVPRELEDSAGTYDVILAVDIHTLPLAFALAKGSPVVFDAHEYFMEEHSNETCEGRKINKVLRKTANTYIPLTAWMVTVSEGLADRFAKDYNIPRPEVVYSGPEFFQLSPSEVPLDKIRLVHHGLADPARHLESMIDVMSHLDSRFSLDMYLDERYSAGIPYKDCPGGYKAWLRLRAANDSRVRFPAPVPMLELPRHLHNYDLELIFFPDESFRLKYCMPNKFFESIQARIGLAVGPSPDMARVVDEWDLGVVVDEFSPEEMANALNALTREDIQRFKQNAHAAANTFNAENNMKLLRNLLLQTIQ